MNDDEEITVRRKGKDNDYSAIASVINKAIGTSGDVLTELIRTAQTNPAVGILVTFLVCDIFVKIPMPFGLENPDGSKGILSTTSSVVIKTMVGTAGAVTITADILGVVASIIPTLRTGANPDNSILIPTVTTLVNARSFGIDPASAAELGKK
jgi:hypothetical protein